MMGDVYRRGWTVLLIASGLLGVPPHARAPSPARNARPGPARFASRLRRPLRAREGMQVQVHGGAWGVSAGPGHAIDARRLLASP